MIGENTPSTPTKLNFFPSSWPMPFPVWHVDYSFIFIYSHMFVYPATLFLKWKMILESFVTLTKTALVGVNRSLQSAIKSTFQELKGITCQVLFWNSQVLFFWITELFEFVIKLLLRNAVSLLSHLIIKQQFGGLCNMSKTTETMCCVC